MDFYEGQLQTPITEKIIQTNILKLLIINLGGSRLHINA